MAPRGARPSLEDLDLLVAVAEAGSIGAVATARRLSQPQLSRRLSALERRLGTKLLDRSTRGSALTANGQVVVDWAVALLAAADEFSRSVDALGAAAASDLSIAVSMTIAEHLAPRWLGELHVADPRAHVSIRVENSRRVIELVRDGEHELGFVETPAVPAELAHRRVGRDRLTVAVAPSHPWAGRAEPVTAAELAAAPLLVREPGSGTRFTLDRALERYGLTVTEGMVVASNTALKAAASAGVGPVILSSLALEDDVRSGRLREVDVAGLDLQRPFTAVWRPERPLGEAARALLAVAAATT
ncbi:LysR family transcriptional regulator [Gordonia sp. (in: high G+C Gram-positive bacteria)]|uniref:LysR family transcriptional regulator n=1 Tax=Gordonia sp. (in: high G+C Gram-positive bacteria) TaxID=84139 RepID=UPI0039E44244